MDTPGDKLATTQQTAPNNPALPTRAPKHKTKGKPVATVGFGSAKVPVYRCASGGRIRFAISYHREGRRMRQFFTDLAAAKKEALLVAQRIQSGTQQLTDSPPKKSFGNGWRELIPAMEAASLTATHRPGHRNQTALRTTLTFPIMAL